jgi:hypothetical protein
MFGDLHTAVWMVPLGADAFRVEECKPTDKTSTEPCLVWREGGPFREYWIMAARESLYRRLAAVSPTPDGILEFARQYGRLGEGTEEFATLPDGSRRTVEPLRGWRKVIVWLAEAVRLWDLANGHDRAALSEVVRWAKGEVGYRMPRRLQKVLHGELLRGRRIRWLLDALNPITSFDGSVFTPGDVVEPARCFALHIVNGFLNRAAQPALLWDSKAKRVLLRHYPRSLLGAVALQFGTAILSGRTTRICPVCQRYFEVTAQASRNDRLTCSDRCRIRAYRDRQERARQLHAKGWTAKRIANELGSEADTVKKWITEGEE